MDIDTVTFCTMKNLQTSIRIICLLIYITTGYDRLPEKTKALLGLFFTVFIYNLSSH